MLDVDGSGDGGGEEVVALLSGDLFAMLVGLDGECFVLRNGFFRVSFTTREDNVLRCSGLP